MGVGTIWEQVSLGVGTIWERVSLGVGTMYHMGAWEQVP